MKVTTEIVKIIVNQNNISNEVMFDCLRKVADLNNISIEYVLENLDSFLQEVCKSVRKITDGLIQVAKQDIFIK